MLKTTLMVLAIALNGHAIAKTTPAPVIASWYGAKHAGKKMANGKRFDPEALTAAHRTLPLGSVVRVVNLRTNKSVIVQITDRGPYIKGRKIDLSRRAARSIGVEGLGRVKIIAMNK